jgi:vancomycin resistance protein YoaR
MYVSSVTRQRGRRRVLVVLVVVGVVAATLVVAAGALALSDRDTLPARTVVGGVDVGGMSRADARRAVSRAAERQRRQPVTLIAPDLAGDGRVTVTGALLGARPQIDQAIAAADDAGFPSRITRRLGLGDVRTVTLRYAFDSSVLDRLRDQLDITLSAEPTDATVTVTATGADVEPSVPGRSVDVALLARRLRELPRQVRVPITVVDPAVTTTAANRAAATIDAVLRRPRTVAIGTTSTVLTPAFLRRALVVEQTKGELVVGLDPGRLRNRLRPVFRDRLRTSRDASFRVDGRRVTIVPSAPGRELDVQAVSRALVSDPGSAVVRARFRSVAPGLTTAEAKALRIREQVSEFTTYYPCCAPRVTNIQRAAQLLDGTVLRPGESFSLNGALGRRTVENGFVLAPQILGGKLEDAVGGGISQVSTTLYNAAFFAGLRLDAHQAHQFYISRYPMGREATISWGGPEMIFTNDWSAGLLIKVSAWSTGVNVRFFSSKLGRRVETVTEEPYAYVQPTTRTIRNPDLKPGERHVLQEAGPAGFTVEYTRKVYRGDKLIKDERYRTRYDAENAYIEVGPPKKPKPKPKPEPEKTPGTTGGTPTTPDEGTTPPSGETTTTPTTTTG